MSAVETMHVYIASAMLASTIRVSHATSAMLAFTILVIHVSITMLALATGESTSLLRCVPEQTI